MTLIRAVWGICHLSWNATIYSEGAKFLNDLNVALCTSFTQSIYTSSGPIQPPTLLVPRNLSPGVKQLWHETDYWAPPSSEIKNEWRYTSCPPIIPLWEYRYNFTFNLASGKTQSSTPGRKHEKILKSSSCCVIVAPLTYGENMNHSTYVHIRCCHYWVMIVEMKMSHYKTW